ncbi:NAD(P)/FAD-dependent oxidoreductase [Pseudomonas sp. zjy_14]|uniref:NAD(P)/FAD-dependent oxidoreductase n=1 Tax=Pseudomonas sp. zjy_14 TaxID=3367264 RepID=UPI00370B3FB6
MQKIKNFPKIDGELGWYETSPSRQQTLGKRLKGHHTFDIAIIGAGYTGLSLAHRLAENNPDASIAIIDALRVGQGTSGRNAGFIIDLPHNLDAGEPDVEHDRQLHKLNTFSIERLRGFKDTFNIDCNWQNAGKYMAAHETSNLGGLDSFVNTLKSSNFEYQDLDAQELKRRLGTNYYQRAIYTPGNILMNPSSLVRGVAAALPKTVHLFEESPIISCEYGHPHILTAVGGTIRAKLLIQTTNSYTEEFGLLSNRLAPVFTYASLTEPLTDSDYEAHFKDVQPWGLTSAHPAGTTVRLTPDRRIFIRNVLDFEPSLSSSNEGLHAAWTQHRKSFEQRFPALRKTNFEFTWGGMLCMTMNHQSVFKKAEDNLFVVGGCNGVGVAKGTYLGYYMADYISGIRSTNLDFILGSSNPSWVPPDPIRTLGARMRLRYESRNAGGDI